MRRATLALSIASISFLAGCMNNAVLIPSSDASLNKKASNFAIDAKSCFPYPADAQRGGDISARAEIGYMWNIINLVNYSGENWDNVEVWVNKQYVLPLVRLESGAPKRISFKMFYNEQGTYLPLEGVMVESLELKKNGTLYTIATQIGG